jgi:hypothetical protein
MDMTLPFEPIQKKYAYIIDFTAQDAVFLFSLPGYCGSSGSACDKWWAQNRKYFIAFFEAYGTSIVVQASIGGRIEGYSVWDAHLATTAEGEKKLETDAEADFTAATGLPGTTGTHDPNVKNNALVCVGGSNATCTKADISPGASGAYAKSIDTSHKLLQYKLLPISELLDNFDGTIKLALEQATQYYIHRNGSRSGIATTASTSSV